MKRKIVIGICLLLVFVGGVVTVLALNGKDEEIVEKPKFDNTIQAECPYTLEELEKAITSGKLLAGKSWDGFSEKSNDMAYVIFNFYDYFSKETKVTVWDTFNMKTGEITYTKIGYDEFMKRRERYYFFAQDTADFNPYSYQSWLGNMMQSYAKFI